MRTYVYLELPDGLEYQVFATFSIIPALVCVGWIADGVRKTKDVQQGWEIDGEIEFDSVEVTSPSGWQAVPKDDPRYLQACEASRPLFQAYVDNYQK
jgi:hypothetical protein